MKILFVYIFFFLSFLSANAQYYLRGTIKDEKDLPLQNVKMLLHSTGMIYYSGNTGGFGITTAKLHDSLTLSIDGYESRTCAIKADVFQTFILKTLSSNSSKNRQKLISITKDRTRSYKFNWQVSDESYFSLVENEEVNASKFPNTAFSLNVNKASYSNIRRFLHMDSKVPPDAVRIEELLNYFNLRYKEPADGKVFNIESQYTDCPWDENNKLLLLNISAKKLNLDKVPPSNLVFLIDASGSMDMPNRLPLVKAAFQMLVKNLRPIDTVSIVIYGGTVSVWLQPTSGAEKKKILESIEVLNAAGDTPGESAIRAAYKVAENTFIHGGNNRVILATDGDFNVGETSEQALEDLITRERQTGVYLTCLGVGMGNLKDSKLETLAKRGNGNYAYLDDIREAEKVLVKEVTQTFFAVADDVLINVQFNTSLIKQYRLIGFDNKKNAISDTIGELEGGEVGSGNNVLAIFEIVPNTKEETGTNVSGEDLAEISVNYSLPGNGSERHKMDYQCKNNYIGFNEIDKEYRLATAIAMFGMKLRESKYLRDASWSDIEAIGLASYDQTDFLQKEFMNLVAIAKKMYPKKKRGKKD